MKEFLKKQFTMDFKTAWFYIKWANFGILGVDIVSQSILGDFQAVLAYALTLMWCTMFFNAMKSRDMAMDGWKDTLDFLHEIIDMTKNPPPKPEVHDASELKSNG